MGTVVRIKVQVFGKIGLRVDAVFYQRRHLVEYRRNLSVISRVAHGHGVIRPGIGDLSFHTCGFGSMESVRTRVFSVGRGNPRQIT